MKFLKTLEFDILNCQVNVSRIIIKRKGVKGENEIREKIKTKKIHHQKK